jgi:arylsulfatase A-like enzyme
MSAISLAAGPNIVPRTLHAIRNIDVTPTILELLGVKPASTVNGSALPIVNQKKK